MFCREKNRELGSRKTSNVGIWVNKVSGIIKIKFESKNDSIHIFNSKVTKLKTRKLNLKIKDQLNEQTFGIQRN